MSRIGVVLSGCGVYDGSEVHEAVLTLLALERAGAEVIWMAPDVDQAHVVDHATGQVMEGVRNVRVESARIARGPVRDIQEVAADELDGLIFPGGYGAAKNLSTFAFEGEVCTVHGDVTRLVKQMHQAGKPLGFICISPVVAARIFGGEIQLELTIGSDPEAAEGVALMGGKHVECAVGDLVEDVAHKVVSTPAYMCACTISEAATGIDKLVNRVVALSGRQQVA